MKALIYIIINYGNEIRTRDIVIVCFEPLISSSIMNKIDNNEKYCFDFIIFVIREIFSNIVFEFLSNSLKNITNITRLKQIIDS